MLYGSPLAEGLRLAPGYKAEACGEEIRLIGPDGSPVACLRGTMAPGEGREEWQDLCESLLMLVRSHAVECEILRKREKRLGERVEELRDELDATHRVADVLYEFFSHAAQKAVDRERTRKGRADGCQTPE